MPDAVGVPGGGGKTEALETPEEIVAMAEPEAAQEDVLLGEGEEAALPNGADVPLDADHFPDANFRSTWKTTGTATATGRCRRRNWAKFVTS